MMEAYVTLLTNNDFMWGTLVLNESLIEAKSKYPLYCIVTPSVSNETKNTLKRVGINLIEKPTIEVPQAIKDSYADRKDTYFIDVFAKLHIFDLTEFDKIVYLDSDIMIRKNVDDLFEKPPMSAVVDCQGIFEDPFDDENFYMAKGDKYYTYFNSGVMVIQPDHELFVNIVNYLYQVQPAYCLQDQNFLSMCFSKWNMDNDLHLPVYYNTFAILCDSYMKKYWFNPQEVRIWHFVCHKPFLFNYEMFAEKYPNRPNFLKLVSSYQNYLVGIINKYNINLD